MDNVGCYHLALEASNYTMAKNYCNQKGGILAEPLTALQQDTLVALIQSTVAGASGRVFWGTGTGTGSGTGTGTQSNQ